MTSKTGPLRLLLLSLPLALSLSGCIDPVVVERPKEEPSQAERQVCIEITDPDVFPTWAYDGMPETVANRIDTEVSVEQGLKYTAVVEAVCPGRLGPQ